MAIAQGLCTSFKTELLNGIHAFGTTVVRASNVPDVFKIALYSSLADLGPNTLIYTTDFEVSGGGYTTGGKVLTQTTPASLDTTAYVDFADVSWNNANFTARAALIYNSTQGNKAVAVLDFGADKTANGGTFTIQFPTATVANAIIRIS